MEQLPFYKHIHHYDSVIEQSPEVIKKNIDYATNLEAILIKPNINDPQRSEIEQVIELINGQNKLDAYESVFGKHLVNNGNIGLIERNGNITAVPAGRWLCPNPRSHWIGVFNIIDEIKYETLTIKRVPKGKYGLGFRNGRALILAEGLHVYNDRQFVFHTLVDAYKDYISNSTIHILRIPQGYYGLVEYNNSPHILTHGTYVIDSALFKFTKIVSINEKYIQHQTIHILRVAKNELEAIIFDTKPVLLPEGYYIFNTSTFERFRTYYVSDKLIKFGTLTRFRIDKGEVGLAWYNSNPLFIDMAGIYEIDYARFEFTGSKPANDSHIFLGSRHRIVVQDGQVGINYKNGKLEILAPDTYEFDTNDNNFIGYLSTRQDDINLAPEGGDIRCDTKDLVEISIRAAVYYQIVDPAKALTTLGNEEKIRSILREIGVATIQNIVRSTYLNQVAQSSIDHTTSANARQTIQQATTPSSLFFNYIHDEAVNRLNESLCDRHGVEVVNIRVESFRIVNRDLSDNISSQAINTAQIENKMANLAGQRNIARSEQEQQAEVAKIESEMKANQIRSQTESQNNARLAEAEAKAKARIIEARAEAEARNIQAQAEADAIKKMAEAEKERANVLDTSEIAQKLALFERLMPVLTASLSNIEKLVVMDPHQNFNQMLQVLAPNEVNEVLQGRVVKK